ALAFVALHLDNPKEAFHAADEAIGIDPKLTWIGYTLVQRYGDSNFPGVPPVVDAWVARLAAFEPDNALPWIARATVIATRKKNFPQVRFTKGLPPDASPLSGETD